MCTQVWNAQNLQFISLCNRTVYSCFVNYLNTDFLFCWKCFLFIRFHGNIISIVCKLLEYSTDLIKLNPAHILTFHLLTYILTLSFHLRLCLPNGRFPSDLLSEILCEFLISLMHATCPHHIIFLDLNTLTPLDDKAPNCAILFSLLLLPLSSIHTFYSALCSQTPSIYDYVLPLWWQIKFHIRIKQVVWS
jgi:hypothetical protein